MKWYRGFIGNMIPHFVQSRMPDTPAEPRFKRKREIQIRRTWPTRSFEGFENGSDSSSQNHLIWLVKQILIEAPLFDLFVMELDDFIATLPESVC